MSIYKIYGADVSTFAYNFSKKGFGGYNLFIVPNLTKDGEISSVISGTMTAIYRDTLNEKSYGVAIEYDTVEQLVNAVAKLYNEGAINDDTMLTHLVEIELRQEAPLPKARPLILVDSRGIDRLLVDRLISDHNIVPFGYSDSVTESIDPSFKAFVKKHQIEGIIEVKLLPNKDIIENILQ